MTNTIFNSIILLILCVYLYLFTCKISILKSILIYLLFYNYNKKIERFLYAIRLQLGLANQERRPLSYLERLKREQEEIKNPTIYLPRKKNKELHFKNIIKQNYKSKSEVLSNIINPFSGYMIADYYLGDEVEGINLNNKINLDNFNYEIIKDNSIIMCQIKKLKFFVEKIIPKLNCKVILITGQEQLDRYRWFSTMADKIINSPKIIRWFSQNPRYKYKKISKYYAFPYGICHTKCYNYYKFLISNKELEKEINLSNLYSSVHGHLHSNHIRKMYPIFSKSKKLEYKEFLIKISKSKYLISTSGDRDDCYRHYEAIGLNTIPVSNIGFLYKRIFGDNMLYLDEKSIINAIKYNKVNHEYIGTNRDLITTSYWKEYVYNPE